MSKKQQQAKDIKLQPQYSKIGKGEYELHVFIQATSGLSTKQAGGIDAMIKVSALGKAFHTQVKKNTGIQQTRWDEHFYFPINFQTSAEAKNQSVYFYVYDYNRVVSDTLIGSYTVDLQRIYSENQHKLEHVWLALTNPSRNFSQVAGYIKISASLIGQKDQNVQLEYQSIDYIDINKKVLIPPQVERKLYQIEIDVIEGRNLKPVDGQKIISYVLVSFGQSFFRTDFFPRTFNPKYKTRLFLPASSPIASQNLTIHILEFNYIQQPQFFGTLQYELEEYIKDLNAQGLAESSVVKYPNLPINQYRWVNFYGPTIESKRGLAKEKQQFYPETATSFVGSLLMKVRVYESPEPFLKREQNIPIQSSVIDNKPPKFFLFQAAIIGAINLYQKEKKYKVCVRVGAQGIQTNHQSAHNGMCYWNVVNSFTVTVSSIQEVPDIFVYLVNSKDIKICYKRYKPREGVIVDNQWIALEPDLSILQLNSQEAGYLKFALKMMSTVRKQAPRIVNTNSASQVYYQQNRRSGRLIAQILSASSLSPLDNDGSIDSFFVVSFMQSQNKSSVKNDTLNPNFYQKIILETDIPPIADCPPIIIKGYDKDKASVQFLGSCFVDVGEAIRNNSLSYGSNPNPEKQTQPSWYNITYNGLFAGKILLRFSLLPNFTQPISPKVDLSYKFYQIMLVVMGLRNLKNSAIFDVKQPFIQFYLDGLNLFAINQSIQIDPKQKAQVKGRQKRKKVIKTQPKQKGVSVNINTIIPVKVMLPSDFKYWPSLSAKVKDNIVSDIYQPTLGYFSLDLQKSYEKSKRMKEEFSSKTKFLTAHKSKITNAPPKMQGVSQQVLLALRNFLIKSINYNWKVVSPQIKNSLNSLKNQPNKKLNTNYTVIFPSYQLLQFDRKSLSNSNQKPKYVEKNKQIMTKNGQYMEVGFDDMKTRGAAISTRNKHYRFVLNQSYQNYYERVTGQRLGIMDEIPIRVGRVFNSKDKLSYIMSKLSKPNVEAGTYKGQIYINQFYQTELAQKETQEFKKEAKQLMNLLAQRGKVHMYLYIIEAANLPSKDSFSSADPYIVVKAGSQKLSFEKDYFKNNTNPQFFKKVHMVLSFPEDVAVNIEVWDHNSVIADELIGSAKIDIENRVHAKLVDAKFNNPIETHNLAYPTSKRSQGLVRFWLDLVPIDQISLYRQFDISRKSGSSFQVRIIVWSISQMPTSDFEDMSDFYVLCDFNGETQQTDVHYRNSNGQGYFNWRMVFNIQLPTKNPLVTFKVFDKDLFNKDDYLCSGSINIQKYLDQAFQLDSSVVLYLGTEDFSKDSEVCTARKKIINGQELYDRFNINLLGRQLYNDAKKSKIKQSGNIQCSIQILTKEDYLKKPAGKGRSQPNQHPRLPQPKNRLNWSINPITMAGRFCGPRFKKKLALALLATTIIGLIIYFGISFSGSIIGSKIGSSSNN